jgi:hypothetical protein
MGLVYATATVTPGKQELLEAWLPAQPWASGSASVSKVAEYRFDDPDGEVGVETIVWRTVDHVLLQVPFTYRGAPVPGAEAYLVGTSEHSVLGPRWVYDGCADPVWAQTMATAVLTGGRQAQMVIERDGQRVDVPARIEVRGSGSADGVVPAVTGIDSVQHDGVVTRVVAGGLSISLPRVLGTPVTGPHTLTGTILDDPASVTFAAVDRV